MNLNTPKFFFVECEDKYQDKEEKYMEEAQKNLIKQQKQIHQTLL